ncbi:oligosaccharide flippase family protein [Vibrio splendidus]|uniref:oligosaccharide flippase family protein n=1 Tax=Vibrio splendidus TaxID=29497 RepID=UPI000D341081|nr:polysaccharide biosynthesis C-terminal domain-containing protein [Vibrio splendidus]PTO78184.1 hypothetical protein CWN93_19875 [Vibrio splendidus]
MLINIIKAVFRQLGAGGMQFLIIIIVARNTGVDTTGQFNLILSLPLVFATFLSLGLNSSNVYFISGNLIDAKEVLTASIVFYVGLSIPTTLVYFVIITVFPQFNVIEPLLQFIILLSAFILLFHNNNLSILQAKENFSTMNVLLLLQPALLLFFVFILLAYNSFNIELLLYTYALTLMIVCLISTRQVINRVGIGGVKHKQVKLILGKIVPYGIKSYVTNLCAVLNYKADMFILAALSGISAVGIYTVAVQISERLTVFSQAISLVVLPRLSSTAEGKALILSKIFRLSLIFQLIISVIFVAMLQALIVFLFGIEFESAVLTGWVLIPGMLFISLNRILANYFASEGLPMVNFKCSLIALIFNILLNVMLIPDFSYLGAAIATSFSYLINLMLTVFFLIRHDSRINLIDLFMSKKQDFKLKNNEF